MPAKDSSSSRSIIFYLLRTIFHYLLPVLMTLTNQKIKEERRRRTFDEIYDVWRLYLILCSVRKWQRWVTDRLKPERKKEKKDQSVKWSLRNQFFDLLFFLNKHIPCDPNSNSIRINFFFLTLWVHQLSREEEDDGSRDTWHRSPYISEHWLSANVINYTVN